MAPSEFLEAVLCDFKSKPLPAHIKKTADELAAEVCSHARIVVGGVMVERPSIATGSSKIGGAPDLPDGLEWPSEERSEDDDDDAQDDEDGPLAFLAQVNLAEVHPHDLRAVLPATGMIWFFTIADGDRGYDIDSSTTRVVYRASPGPLTSRSIPEPLAENEDATIEERAIEFGPSLCLTEVDPDSGALESLRFDGSIETAIAESIEAAGGKFGVIQLLGDAHFFREELHDEFDRQTQEVLFTVDGYAVAEHAFGEGGFTWISLKKDLASATLENAHVVFEGGT